MPPIDWRCRRICGSEPICSCLLDLSSAQPNSLADYDVSRASPLYNGGQALTTIRSNGQHLPRFLPPGPATGRPSHLPSARPPGTPPAGRTGPPAAVPQPSCPRPSPPGPEPPGGSPSGPVRPPSLRSRRRTGPAGPPGPTARPPDGASCRRSAGGVNWVSSNGRADTVADGRSRRIPVSCSAATHMP